MTNDQIVSEDQVQKALDYLRDSAETIGDLTYEARRAEHVLKHLLALEMKKYDTLPISGQEREARASEAYYHGSLADARAAGDLAKEKALREAAAMKLEIYRTQSSNWRSMKVG